MTSAPQNKPAEAPTTGQVLKEIRQGSAAQQREIQNQLKQKPQNPQGRASMVRCACCSSSRSVSLASTRPSAWIC